MYIVDRCHFTGQIIPNVEDEIARYKRKLIEVESQTYQKATRIVKELLKDDEKFKYTLEHMYHKIVDHWYEEIVGAITYNMRCSREEAIVFLKHKYFPPPKVSYNLLRPIDRSSSIAVIDVDIPKYHLRYEYTK